jgi:hypothetical protein
MSVRAPHLSGMDTRKPGDRVIQIPVEWPARHGTVLEVKAGTSPAEVLIGWDDGRRDWIENEELRPLRIWFIDEDGTEVEPRPGPLETQLSKFLGNEAGQSNPSRFPKGHL